MWDQTALGNQPWGSCGGCVSTVPGVGRPWPPLSGEGREPQALGWLAFEPKWPEAPVVQRGCEGRERGRPRAGFLGGGRGGSVCPRDGSAWPGDQYLGWSVMGVLCGAHRRGHLGSLAVVVRGGEERWVQPWGTHPLPGHRHRRRAERPLPAAAVRCLPATRNPRSQGAWPLTPDPLHVPALFFADYDSWLLCSGRAWACARSIRVGGGSSRLRPGAAWTPLRKEGRWAGCPRSTQSLARSFSRRDRGRRLLLWATCFDFSNRGRVERKGEVWAGGTSERMKQPSRPGPAPRQPLP